MEEQKIKDIEGKNGVKVFTILLIIICLILFGIYWFYSQKQSITFGLLGRENVILEIGEDYEEEGFIANIKDNNISDKVEIYNNINTKKVGNYEIIYNLKMKYFLFDKTLIRKVYVKDSIQPTLTINGEKEITIKQNEKYSYPSCTAIDNYDGDITENVEITSNLDTKKPGSYEINYSVHDSSGNETTDKVIVKVRDKNPYIVVSIKNQTLQYYEYDKVVLSSNVVTGINGKTPTGNFKVLNKATDIILKGKDYESFVSYWIAFKGASFGFHDASWRSKFGGTIYKTNGSHGCVNMPYSKVKSLYNRVSIGTPVYIKN